MSEEIEQELEAQLEALSSIEDLKREKEDLFANRAKNFPAVVVVSRKEHEANKRSLKSDLKKTNAFVKKIRSINTEGLQQCIRDTETLNLTLYISEIVGAIVETAYKATDVPSMIKLCVDLHRRYDEFTGPLLSGLRSALFTAPAEDDTGAGKRKRIQIRFIVELFQVGICLDDELFCQLLRSLIGKVKGSTIKQPMDLLGLATFVKYGSESLLGFSSRRMHQLARQASKPVSEMPVKLLASHKAHMEMSAEVSTVYQQLTIDLAKAHRDYKSRERRNEKDKLIHGSITEQKLVDLEGAKRLFEKLFAAVSGLADATGGLMPALEEDKDDEDAGRGSLSVWDAGTGAGAGDYGPFGDAESRAFYEDLPDLLAMVPLSALGLTPEQAAAIREEWKVVRENAYTGGQEDADAESAADIQEIELGGSDETDRDRTGIQDPDDGEESGGKSAVDEKDKVGAEEEKEDTPQARVLLMLQEKLPECTNKQRCDEFCTSFCYLNSKGARKKLVQALIKLPRSRLDLTSTYSRVIASLHRVMSKEDIAAPVLEALKREFFGMTKSKQQQQYIDGKIRNVRYLAELVKFGVAPPIVAFRMFKTLMADFTPHNIELTAVLLESCGRYLYLLPYTHERTCEVIDMMLRLRRAKNLDLRLQTLLEAAYFAVKPPERVARKNKVLTNVQKYIRFLLFEKLDTPGANVDLIIKALRRLPWNSEVEGVEGHILKCALRVARTKYVSIPTLADCLSGLFRYRPNLLVKLVDRILEELQRGLDVPHKREPQRLLGLVRVLGELYNYSVVSAPVIYELLYTVINYGHLKEVKAGSEAAAPGSTGRTALSPGEAPFRYDPRVVSDLDLPADLFRAQLVCEALNTCGAYYVRGQAKERLSRYLVYFQRYLLSKPLLPTHIEFAILDTFDNLEELARSAAIASAVKLKSAAPALKGKNTASALAALKAAATIEILSAGPLFPRYDSLDQAQIAIELLEIKPEEAVQDVEEDEDEEVEPDAEEVGDDENADEESAAECDFDAEEIEREEQLLRRRAEEEEEELSEREAARMLERMRATEEDEEFERAFRSMVHESVQGVRTVGTFKSAGTDRMAIPAVLPKPKNIIASRFRTGSAEDEDLLGPEMSDFSPFGGKAVVAFKLLSRDTRGRVEARQLLVPEEAPMAVKLAKAEAALKQEKMLLKERVLQIDSLTEMGEELPAPIEYVHNRSLDPDGDRQGGGRGQGQGGRSSGRVPSGRSSVQAGRGFGGYALRTNEERKPVDTLDLDQFLAETNKSEMRAMHSGRPQAGGQSSGRGGVAPGSIAPSGLYVPGGSSNNGNWRERR